ncbi:hypothetical protein PV328_005507 [Microctonus aethiopoides]|uniref:Uncharacterized protein n=1 Tax=Microctonus aethiopoides TaxID=144406 RepID=A0AA39FM56_9HYME|nr:hypothetical protein PV328_005507 [Microctonus aethiopoides]
MIRIVFGTSLIFLMFGGGFSASSVSFIDIESIFLWKNSTYNDAVSYWLITKEFSNMSMRGLDQMMIEVDTLSEHYDEFTNDLRKKQDERWKLSVDRGRRIEFFSPVKFELSTLINKVDIMHKERINFRIERQYMNEMLRTRIPFLLETMQQLLRTLEQIHRLIFPSFSFITPQLLQLILVDAEKNLPDNCDQYNSAQQFVYYIYITLIITEMKGFSTLIHISSMLQHTTKSNNYITEIEIAEKKFTKRVTDYYNHIYKGMFSMPREIHRCEIQFPKRGENFLELTHVHQIWLITSGHLMAYDHLYRLNCYKQCEDIDTKPLESMTDLQINDCETLGLAQLIKSCPAGAKSSRRYMWWTYDDKIYGHDEGCPTALQQGNGDTPYYDHCHICQCTVIPQDDQLYPNSVLRISITAQVSDIKNNMIVSGIKFVIYKNVLHLQIQQSKFVLENINDNSSEWKSLESSQSYLNNSKIQTEMLSKFSGQIYLDDVILPPEYAVTGVRFRSRSQSPEGFFLQVLGVRFRSRSQSPEGFFLQVLGAPIDLETGMLDTTRANWYSANSLFSKTKSYERNRIEINVKNRDDPTRCKGYDYDRTANNYIKFYHSSVLKDGGQSTVPFIDAQPVETYPPFPLGGIGLFYRSKDGCGGYITPRGFTASLVSFIKIESIFLWKNETYDDAVSYWLMAKEFSNMTMRELDQMMIEVKTLSEHYNEFTNDLREKQVENWKLSVDRRRRTEFFSPVKFELSTLINKVEFMHKEIINFKNERQYVDEMLHARVQILLDTIYDLLKTLERIQKLIFPSFPHITPQLLQLILVDAEKNLPDNCDQYTSAQQFVYYIYITLIITEMKGFSTLIYISSILQHVTKSNDYITEIEIAEKKFTKRENFLELTHAHQIWLITSGHLMGDEHLYRLNCYKRCEKIDPKWMGIITDLQINDCETLGLAQFIKSCPAGAKSSRRYMWWTYDGKIYGHDEGCPTALQNGNGDTPYYDQCHICQCTVIPQNDEAYPNSILRISITAQVSDIKNNMIVSGIKFVIYKNVLHLQIQQSKFVLKNINDNSSEWKSLESSQSYLNNSKIQTEMLSKFSGQIYLDDVMLPPKYAVTGVRFRSRSQSPEGFFLQVLGAPIDLETGRLNIIKANWYSANPILSKTKSYERNRIEINVKNLDDPIRCKGYDYDKTANNYIKFYHSSVLKDGGQSTVPFIDAQPVETYPPFPLGGIGLFYRSKDGCGGYITPRIFTIDISSYN